MFCVRVCVCVCVLGVHVYVHIHVCSVYELAGVCVCVWMRMCARL